MEQRSHFAVLCHCVYTAMNMAKRKKTRELSEEVRHKIVAKHGQPQGYKSIYRDLDVPVSTVSNVIRKFKAHGTGTVANLKATSPSTEILRFLCPPYAMLSGSLRPMAL